jgi:hypothetical protein
MYESRSQRPVSRAIFLRRLLLNALIACALLGGSLAIGMVGYMSFEHLPWIDAFLNAAMLLGGMGPVDAPKSDSGKLFAGFYALYAGLVFIATAAFVFTPILHRVVHKFHWAEKL